MNISLDSIRNHERLAIVGHGHADTIDNLDDLEKAAETLRQELTDEVIAWCYLIQNAADDLTHVLLVLKDRHMTQTVDRVLSRGKDVIPEVMNFLSK